MLHFLAAVARVKELLALTVFFVVVFFAPRLKRRSRHLSYPELADEQASFLQAHAALLLDDLLDVLENIAGHRHIPAHVDVSSLLPQALVHPL